MKKPKYLLTPIALAILLAGCNNDSNTYQQPILGEHVTNILQQDGYQFKDLNKNGVLDPYEDWRNTISIRVDDLVSRMTLEEKVGMMLIDTMNAAAYGATNETHVNYIDQQKMTRFIFRNSILTEEQLNGMSESERNPSGNVITGLNSAPISPREAARYMNLIQELCEGTRLGIPALFKSNARNHLDPNALPGINVSAGAFSEWPKEGGLAAAALGDGDMSTIEEFARVMKDEWKAIGLRGMYGYMADLSTEPRWHRVHETFSEDSDLTSNIITTLVSTLQGSSVSSDSIVLTMKHFPGGGPQFIGLDPHYIAGQHQSYPTHNFEYHVKPFIAAVNAGVAAIMPYYGVVGGGEWKLSDLATGQTVAADGTNLYVGTRTSDGQVLSLADVVSDRVKDTLRVPNNDYNNDATAGTPTGNVGVAFSAGILNGLLRQRLGFTGVINSDTGIINDPNTGVPDDEAMQNNRAWGLQDKSKNELFKIAIDAGTDVFSGFHRNADIMSAVQEGAIPETRIDQSVKRLLTVQFELGLFENPYVDESVANQIVGSQDHQNKADIAQRKSVVLLKSENALLPLPTGTAASDVKLFTLGVNDGVAAQYGFTPVSDMNSADKAVVRVRVTNRNTGALVFGGAKFDEVDVLDFTGMSQAQTWDISPSLAEIKQVMDTVGAENTVLSIYFRHPFVLDDVSGLKNAGAILATFGASDSALFDVLTGRFTPKGKLPFALANSAQAIIDQASDAPGYTPADTLYGFGYGLTDY
ncbi:glycoside hydrolase family 3 N-terminal domain-containing protein [Vibrio porteresiae]|uniref:beta-glucosidase n=1 Tax=Vibrio porteresiae DSM 19223 TaxID=1123496 RepID=A0ABZ0QM90_9VIBR|nr:glycoside hydrolase family 3 N-terminal domain-containing protein [Vibrio porteresiae]WPC76548.1 glycoside hydrolase family 3 N-terminal domain-containing protein [Vibrio porteresiae DSM 19223]